MEKALHLWMDGGFIFSALVLRYTRLEICSSWCCSVYGTRVTHFCSNGSDIPHHHRMMPLLFAIGYVWRVHRLMTGRIQCSWRVKCMSPVKCPFLWGHPGFRPIHGSLGPCKSAPKWPFNWFRHFCMAQSWPATMLSVAVAHI